MFLTLSLAMGARFPKVHAMISTQPAQAPPSNPTPVPGRLMSVDALRGFDMFWILGADAFFQASDKLGKTGPFHFLAVQLDHADWAGFHFYDLIFPLFVFIVGVSLVFSLGKTIQTAGRGEALKRV